MTVTIHKNSYIFDDQKYPVCFLLSEEISRQLEQWERERDKIVLDEQALTGSFHGRFLVRGTMQQVVQRLREKGVIQPYYGAINPSACVYTLQVAPPNCVIIIEHTVVGETGVFKETLEIAPANITVEANVHMRRFLIKESAYQALQRWPLWNASEEFTARYKYMFAPTTIGVTANVTDTRSGEKFDISDYDD